ncbi:MAG: Gfo/Idh/MocA family oxidoreductase [Actinomycetota bacterium]|nr:Gfo/Idh/MocA family oxidoreductase [Actinomycetota bacterium]MDQ5808498.1 Gfo/Idh/MocA family oxidoreductase [Actinomycetota bacterium]
MMRFVHRNCEPSEPLRVAVVGLGYWGPNLLRVLFELPSVEVTHICDLDSERLASYARRYPSAKATMQYLDVLADDEVDAVLIATPVFTHFDLAARALRAGKHTFVEKPLAPSLAEADELVDLARENDVALMCGQTFLYSPPVRAVKQLIDRRELGDVYFISSSRVNLGLHQRDVSVIWDLGPHDFSILLYWLGELPTSVVACGRDSIVSGIPDVVFLNLMFPSGVVANVELSWLAPSKLRRTAVVGSEKMVVYEDGTPEPVRIYDSGVVYKDPQTFGEYHLSYRTGDILTPRLDSAEPLGVELDEFVALCFDLREPFVDNAALARDVVAICEAAETSLANGGESVRVGAPAPARAA